jgi:hypothetical protein
LERALQEAHDQHLQFKPDVVYKIFNWERLMPIVSLSSDGIQKPSVFVYRDILLAAKNQSFHPSPLVKIDGQDTETFLEELSQRAGYAQDRDALWNGLFPDFFDIGLGTALASYGMFTGHGADGLYPGGTTTYSFANGTTIVKKNIATKDPKYDYTGIESGKNMSERFFDITDLGWPFPQNMRFAEPEAETPKNRSLIHPQPVISEKGSTISGFFLNDTAHSEVAVLSIRSFMPGSIKEYQDTLEQFLKMATAAGKKKLIIDLSSNPGGFIPLAYEVFSQLFSPIEPFGASRYRATPLFGELSKVFSSALEKSNSSTNNSDYTDMMKRGYPYQADHDIEDKPFRSFDQKFGPYPHANDNFTATVRMNFYNNPLFLKAGLNPKRVNKTQPFVAENIVLLYDGNCASTCTIFSELLREQGKVKTIVLGGRPSKQGLIQAVGGTKGAQSYIVNMLRMDSELAFKYATPEQKRTFVAAGIESRLPYARAVVEPSVNFKDAIREGDSTQTALQFVYELADCRLYYTAEMVLDHLAIWKAASDVRWGGKACVAGGFGNTTKVSLARRAIRNEKLTVPTLSEERLAYLNRHLDIRADRAAYRRS